MTKIELLNFLIEFEKQIPRQVKKCHYTECFIDLGKLNLFKISLPWSKSVKLTVVGTKKKVDVDPNYKPNELLPCPNAMS
jgi:hypothetical protein